eukprot:COSAG06_NODE_5028_length_3780_cov_4.915784_3_plen_57_part_00
MAKYDKAQVAEYVDDLKTLDTARRAGQLTAQPAPVFRATSNEQRATSNDGVAYLMH